MPVQKKKTCQVNDWQVARNNSQAYQVEKSRSWQSLWDMWQCVRPVNAEGCYHPCGKLYKTLCFYVRLRKWLRAKLFEVQCFEKFKSSYALAPWCCGKYSCAFWKRANTYISENRLGPKKLGDQKLEKEIVKIIKSIAYISCTLE